MKAEELRLGNYVFDAETRDNIVYEIVSIQNEEYAKWNDEQEYNIVAKKIVSKDDYYELKPIGIKLTEQWLLDFGYELQPEYKADNYIVREYVLRNAILDFLDHSVIVKENEKGKMFSIAIEDDDQDVYELKYVHQLQNAFFIHAGYDLTKK